MVETNERKSPKIVFQELGIKFKKRVTWVILNKGDAFIF